MLFDYTGLPVDAAIQVQKPPLILSEQEQPAGKGMPELMPGSGAKAPAYIPPKPNTQPKREPRQQPPKQPRKREQNRPQGLSRSTIMAIIICSVVAVIAIGIFMLTQFGSKDNGLIEVPDMVGKSYEEMLKNKDLTIRKDEAYDDTIPAGYIISQDYDAGKEVVKGSSIYVVVSMGPRPESVPMPDLKNKTREEAEKELQKLGFSANVTVEEEYNDNFPMGSVIRTVPVASVSLSKDTKITLVVSKGKKIAFGAMPNVVNETREKAEETLGKQDLDLKVVVEEVFHDTIPAGIVIESVPGRGEKLQTNDTVTLRVSKGIQMEEIPDMVGTNLMDARALLKSLGFKKEPVITYVESKEAKDTILVQTPAYQAGKVYEMDAEITLEVSDGSLIPPTITKDVVIDLKGLAQYSRCMVSVKRDGVEVLLLSVPKGTTSVTLYNQEGSGTVYYTVVIDDSDSWVHTEEFVPEATPGGGTGANG